MPKPALLQTPATRRSPASSRATSARRGAGVGEVARLDVGVDAVREPQLLGQRPQPVGAAGDRTTL